MKTRTTMKPALFKEGEIWKERISNAYIFLGPKGPNGTIQCFLASVEDNRGTVSYHKGDFWADATPAAIFNKFIKIL